ncbi:MAG: alpha/beta hydrolase [Pseudomonadota bacterium]
MDQITEIDRYGAGPNLVLVPGSPGNAANWRAAGDKLADRYTVNAVTLPGHVGVDVVESIEATTMTALAAALRDMIGSLTPPVTVMAHSFGGAVTLRALLEGLQVERALLLEPVALSILRTVGDNATLAGTEAVLSGYFDAVKAGEMNAVRRVLEFWFGAGSFAAMPEPVRAYLNNRTAVNVRDVKATLADRYDADALAQISIPTTVAVGTRTEPTMKQIVASLVSALPNAAQVEIEGAGHGMLMTHPGAVANLLSGS